MRGWSSASDLQRAIGNVTSMPARADIRLALETKSGEQWPLDATFKLKSGDAAKQAQAFIALFENKIVSPVAAGENRGVTLRHDYAVRQWIGPIALSNGAADYRATLALDRAWQAKNLGVAAFVQDSASGELLQAVSVGPCS